MTSEEIQNRVNALEVQILNLEKQVAYEESRITKCDSTIAQKESAMMRTNSVITQNSCKRTIASEKKKRLQYSKKRDNFKKQLNQKKLTLLQTQRINPEDIIDEKSEVLNMETIKPEDKIYQVFISSTYKDLVPERDKAMRTIVGMGHLPIGMEDFPATDIEAFEYIKKMIDKADYYLLIIGGKYGSEHPELHKSYTELEFDYAVSINIPVIFLLKDGIKHIDYLDTDPNIKAKLDAFITKASTGRLRVSFQNEDQLANKLEHSLNCIIRDIPRPGWVRADRISAIVAEPPESELDCNSTIALTNHHEPDPFNLHNQNLDVHDESTIASWGDNIKEIGAQLTGPLNILSEQIDYFNQEPQFTGKIKCLLETFTPITVASSFRLLKVKRNSNRLHFENYLSIEAGVNLSFYKQKLIKVASQDPSILPCEISNCLDDTQLFLCNNEEEFKNSLRAIMQSESLRNTIRNLLIMSK